MRFDEEGLIAAIDSGEDYKPPIRKPIRKPNPRPGQSEFTVYILKCEDGKWYVGQTGQFEKRMDRHFSGKGSYWTKLHKPIKVFWTTTVSSRNEALNLEDELTIKTARRYGAENVRGGKWADTRVNPPLTAWRPDGPSYGLLAGFLGP